MDSVEAILDRLPSLHTAVLLIHADDTLGTAALEQLNRLRGRSRLPNVHLLACRLDATTAPILQAIRSPQYRFYRRGNEMKVTIGVETDDDLLAAINAFARS